MASMIPVTFEDRHPVLYRLGIFFKFCFKWGAVIGFFAVLGKFFYDWPGWTLLGVAVFYAISLIGFGVYPTVRLCPHDWWADDRRIVLAWGYVKSLTKFRWLMRHANHKTYCCGCYEHSYRFRRPRPPV